MTYKDALSNLPSNLSRPLFNQGSKLGLNWQLDSRSYEKGSSYLHYDSNSIALLFPNLDFSIPDNQKDLHEL